MIVNVRVLSWIILVISVIYTNIGLPLFGQTVGYLYPAGGQVGQKFEMLIAGSALNTAEKVHITGEGVTATILERPLYGNFEHNNPHGGKCARVWAAIFEEESKLLPLRHDPEKMEEARRVLRQNRQLLTAATPIKLTDIPNPNDEEVFASSVYFHRLRKPTLADLQLIFYEYDWSTIEAGKKRHSQFTSALIVEVAIAPEALPGIRELYVLTTNGLSRAIRFWVGTSPEVMEIEPNEGDVWWRWKEKFPELVQLPTQQIPVVINGQIKPGDIDRFYFDGKKDQRVVFEVQSRSTAPFIANAVPGWFTAVISLFDPEGIKIGYCESWRFDQNPMMMQTLPADGKYMLEVQDSIYRGRNDFVYRLSVGSMPTVLTQFPLGGKANESTVINLTGENLPNKTIMPDFKGDIFYEEVRELELLDGVLLSRPLHYVVETLPVFIDPIKTSGAPSYSSDAAPVVPAEAPKPADPPAEAPKPAAPPAEAPKPAAPPAEAPKPAAPPAEAPKPAAPPAEAPKPADPPAEAPKPADPPAEAPKPAAPPAEVPKPAAPPAEAPKPAAPPAEAPKPAAPPAEAPKPAEPPAEAPKPAEPPAEAPKPAEPPAETPKPAAPPAEIPQVIVPAPPAVIPVPVPFPVVVYGRIETEMQVNAYQFSGKKGQKIALDVMAQQLGSALDAAVELLGPDGKQLVFNDDRADSSGPNIGEQVIHSDPNIVCELPDDGEYVARIFSTIRRGGSEYYYRLRISVPQPDFDLCLIPSRLRFNNKYANFKVKVFRKEGFEGEIKLQGIGSCSEMKFNNNGTIKPGETEASFSVNLPNLPENNIFEVEMVGNAQIGEKTLSRKVLPVDDWEQAFIYHHLVPAKKLMASYR